MTRTRIRRLVLLVALAALAVVGASLSSGAFVPSGVLHSGRGVVLVAPVLDGEPNSLEGEGV